VKSDLNVFDLAVAALSVKNHGQVTFVQVGANDGYRFDPLRKHVLAHNWSGLLIEPQPDVFAELKRNYACQPHLEFEQCAITSTAGPVTMWKARESGQTVVRGNYIARLRMILRGQFRQEITVPGMTLAMALRKHNLRGFDLLQVDCEGHDHEIVHQALGICNPPLIHFESRWVPRRKLQELYARLRIRHYTIHHCDGVPCDTVAINFPPMTAG
jgi:FkbM family methyltransferase